MSINHGSDGTLSRGFSTWFLAEWPRTPRQLGEQNLSRAGKSTITIPLQKNGYLDTYVVEEET